MRACVVQFLFYFILISFLLILNKFCEIRKEIEFPFSYDYLWIWSFPFHTMCELLWMPFFVEFDDVEITGLSVSERCLSLTTCAPLSVLSARFWLFNFNIMWWWLCWCIWYVNCLLCVYLMCTFLYEILISEESNASYSTCLMFEMMSYFGSFLFFFFVVGWYH